MGDCLSAKDRRRLIRKGDDSTVLRDLIGYGFETNPQATQNRQNIYYVTNLFNANRRGVKRVVKELMLKRGIKVEVKS